MDWNTEYVPLKTQRPISQEWKKNIKCPQCNCKEYRYYFDTAECFRCQFTWKINMENK